MPEKKKEYTAWAEVDLKAVRSNFRAVQRLTRKQKIERRRAKNDIRTPRILTVVKGDAYGHGMLPAVKELVRLGVDFLGVSELSEGIALREKGIKKSILVLETPLPSAAKKIVDYDLIATVCTDRIALTLNAYAKSVKKMARVHIKVDTGMGRLGIHQDQAVDFIEKLMRMSNLSVEGLYTHFPLADTNRVFTRKQIDAVCRMVHGLDEKGFVIPYIHAANSMGVMGYQPRIFNMIRPGLMLYGLYPAAKCKSKAILKPVMTVKARVIFVKQVDQGSGISYGHIFVAKKKMKTATLSIGYNDGYMRTFSNKADVLIKGKRCRVLGRVTMDQIVVDVTSIKDVRVGAEAVIMGRQKNEYISADELAAHAGTINYEIVCSFGNRLPRLYYT